MTFANDRIPVRSGFTLIELMVAVGLFAVVMTIATGAYLIMIGADREAHAVTTGINNLSFALEDMTRTIRTGFDYCLGTTNTCSGTDFSFSDATDPPGDYIKYFLNSTTNGIDQYDSRTGATTPLTDSSVDITSLLFTSYNAQTVRQGDYGQARVTIVISGQISYGHGKTQYFTVESSATMRGSDI
ncbi:MAG TPA: type II secretion system protein [Candidatus Paceibacterota bacterium]|nr:type II secretion system protein [Candidatus Paceibacterota bacterium]